MKHIYTMLLASVCSVSAIGQTTDHGNNAGYLLPHWAIDVNLLGGLATQTFTRANTAGNYLNAVSVNPGELKYKDGYSFGGDLQLGYFFGQRRHWGLGTGVLFMQQQGTATLTGFSADYQATDGAGNTFRQVIRGNDVKEDITSSNLNIPVLLKYRTRFSKHWGVTADAGALVNLQMNNAYTTHASFDQEAVYKFVQNAEGTRSVYDNSAVPAAGDWLITKAEFLKNNPNGNWQDYAATKRAMGINVGDALNTGNHTGNKSYTTGSIGFMVQPSFSYYLSDKTSINFGGYYMMQPFKNGAQAGYRTTDGNGSYNSSLNSVTASTNHSYGVNIGARFFLGMSDRDRDGVSDKKDYCPDVYGLAKFHGCPDTDGDGVPDSEDSCATVKGLVQFHGCPDKDGDGTPDKDDQCPDIAGPKELRGCPDKDGDGIIDKNDACPDVFGLAQFHGCPDKDGDGVPDSEDNCPEVAGPASNHGCPVESKKVTEPTKERASLSAPILFDVNRSTVQPASIATIEEAVDELNENKKATIVIDGHADASGPESINQVLSLERANSVKSELTQRGISPSRLKTKGHGSKIPVANNNTYEGKQQNRRAGMTIKK